MLIINKDTIMLKVECLAEANYSGAVSRGIIFVPSEFADIEELSSMYLTAHDLDGKHSEIDYEITVAEGTLEDLISNTTDERNDAKHKLMENVTEFVFGGIRDDSLEKLNEEIYSLILPKTPKSTITLTNDIVLEGITLSKGTVLEYEEIIESPLNSIQFELETN